jgi:penicillin V acylase-like amidase (Ntn superfamily)
MLTPSPACCTAADLSAYLLSQYATVEHIIKNFTPQKFRIVNNPQVYQATLELSPIAATRLDHCVIHDTTGASAVLEFATTADGSFTFAVTRNPNGIATNSPDIATQLQYAEQFARAD